MARSLTAPRRGSDFRYQSEAEKTKRMEDELREDASPSSGEEPALDISSMMRSLMALEKCSPHEVEAD